MDIVSNIAEAYAEKFTDMLDTVLQENEQHTRATHAQAHMLSGRVQGKFLEAISRMIQPSRVLEIGTFTGFSALCLLKGMKEGGVLHTIELREEDVKCAAGWFVKAGVGEKIILHHGNAREIIPTLNVEWDLVFIDADKVGYIDYYEMIMPFVKPGGWILADNVMFHGQVFEEPIKGKNALAINAFNEYVAADSRVEQVMLTIRDALLLIRKL